MTSVRRLFVKAAIGVCALAGLASSGAYAASPDGMKLYQFSSYWLDIGKSALSSATSGDEKIMVPVGFYLIRHPKGDILFDTGNNDRLIQDKTYWGPLAGLLDKGVDPALDKAFMVILGLERFEQFHEIVAAHEQGQIPPTVMWGACPTQFDPGQAPPGGHTAFMWEKLPYSVRGDSRQWTGPRGDGRRWAP